MLSPNMPARREDLSQQQLHDLRSGATQNQMRGTMSQAPLTVPLIKLNIQLPLRWGEWLRIAATQIAATTAIFAISFTAMSALWFGDVRHLVLPTMPLVLSFAVAALVMRVAEVWPRLQRAIPVLLVLGIILTAGILIRLFVFPTLAPSDWSWLGSFSQLTDLTASQPHAELGLMILSVICWVTGLNLARFAGDYERRRRAFYGYIVTLVLVALTDAYIEGPVQSDLVNQLSVALPFIIFMGLMTIGQVRLADLQHRLVSTGGASKRMLVMWRGMTAIIATVTIALGILVGLIFFNGSYRGVFSAVIDAIAAFFLAIVSLVFFFLSPIVSFLQPPQSPAKCVVSTAPTPVPGSTGATLPPCTPQGPKPIKFPAQAQLAHVASEPFFIAFVIIVLLLCVLAVFLVLRRTIRRGEDGAFEEIQEQLVPRKRSASPAAHSGALALDLPGANTVRAAYRDLLGRSAAVGIARQPTETAAEFDQRLVSSLMSIDRAAMIDRAEVDQVTLAYEAERYGAQTTTPQRFIRVRDAIQAITMRMQGERRALRQAARATTPSEVSESWRIEGWQATASIALIVIDGLFLQLVVGNLPLSATTLAMKVIFLVCAVLAVALPALILSLANSAFKREERMNLNRVLALISSSFGFLLILFGTTLCFALIVRIFS